MARTLAARLLQAAAIVDGCTCAVAYPSAGWEMRDGPDGYTLVMATLMITGGKIGSNIGRRRAFAIGCVIYACGSLTTALSPNLTVLIIGWSFLEGFGARHEAQLDTVRTALPAAGRRGKGFPNAPSHPSRA